MLFFLLIPAVFASESSDYYSLSYARLSYAKDDVYVQRGEDLGYEEGTVNLLLIEGDMIGTREGRAEIHFGRRNYLRLNHDTGVELVRLPTRDEDITRVHLLSGSIYLRINTLEIEKSFEIHTPDASFYFLEEGLYRLDVRDSRETELFVFEGAVEAAGEEDSVLVETQKKIAASEGFFLSRPLFFSASLGDDFSDWNSSRDSLIMARATSSYLPPELDEYEAELAANGRWVFESPYGYVWVPYVSHYAWRPYFYGRWVWYPVIGWTWVSYEPWGWCVSRYGRWQWRRGLGWYWIPMRVWGPAWVYWYWGYDYIGWCPLSYYGYPVVVINNIFYGRYYSRYYPYRSRALTVIRKSQLQVRNVSRVALKSDDIRRIGKISLTRRSLDVKPIIKKISSNPEAARVLSRAKVRKVVKGYLSGKRSISPSRLRLNPSRTSAKRIPASSTSIKRYVSRGRSISSASGNTSSHLKKYFNSRIQTRSSEKKIVPRRSFPSRIKIKTPHSLKSSFSLRNYLSRRYNSSSSSRSSLRKSSYPRGPSLRSTSPRTSSSRSISSPKRRSGSSSSSVRRSTTRSSSGGKLRKKK